MQPLKSCWVYALCPYRRRREGVQKGTDKDDFKGTANFVAIDVSSDSEAEDEAEEVLEDYLMRRHVLCPIFQCM